MNNSTRQSLKTVIDYLYEDEKKHFQELERDTRGNHIFVDVCVLKQYYDETK